MSHDPVRRIVLVGAAILAACSSNSPSNPGGGNPPPGPLTGTWVASLGELSGTGAFCRFPTVAITLTETGTSLAGTYESYGKGICAVNGGAYAGATLPGSITGSVNDSVIQLTPNIPNFHLTAVVRGDSLVGTLSRTVTLSGGPVSSVTVTGSWRAARLPANLAAGAAAFIQVQPDLLMISQADSLLPTITVRDSARQGIPVQPPVTLTVLDPAVASISDRGLDQGEHPQHPVHDSRPIRGGVLRSGGRGPATAGQHGDHTAAPGNPSDTRSPARRQGARLRRCPTDRLAADLFHRQCIDRHRRPRSAG